ncbi:hypothetical protein KO566_00375 [Flavobacteriaceae bacterium XHP0103]|uniref:PID-CTERM protein-sorting domain-containing protein n=1 Tax=Marixanthotalea marina TaxID=2844359 RepID=UPI002989E0BF|nr:hypothetical protein [Marixanthotalea marina]MBU3820500.1 hypothetical protein [Marixanthotalea marina]
MMIQKKRKIASILFVLIISTVCLAQGDGLPPPGPTPPPGLPIDGSVLVGLVVGLFYGVKKILKNN